MKRRSLKHWIGVTLLGSALLAGCNHAGRRPMAKHSHSVSTGTPAVIFAAPAGEGVQSVKILPPAPAPGTVEEAVKETVVKDTPLPISVPPVTTAAEPTSGMSEAEAAAWRAAEKGPAVVPVEAKASMPAEPVKPPAMELKPSEKMATLPMPQTGTKRAAFTDVTAHSSFHHNSDYTSLGGVVQYHRTGNKGWRLRYASVDELDPYGGSVTLMDEGNLSQLKDGQHIRVRGQLTDPDARVSAPRYRVSSIEFLDGKN